MSRSRKILRAAKSGAFAKKGSLVAGIVHGLAQMGSFASVGPLTRYPKVDANALRNDWERVGADMRRGYEQVREREKAKA